MIICVEWYILIYNAFVTEMYNVQYNVVCIVMQGQAKRLADQLSTLNFVTVSFSFSYCMGVSG